MSSQSKFTETQKEHASLWAPPQMSMQPDKQKQLEAQTERDRLAKLNHPLQGDEAMVSVKNLARNSSRISLLPV